MKTAARLDLGVLALSGDTREGRMLAAGSLTATVTSRKSGQHVTLRLRSALKTDEGTWERVPFADASHLFVDDFDGERVATFYPRSGVLFYADRPNANVSVAVRWTVPALLRFLDGQFPNLPVLAEIFSADICGKCGQQLTDPESIERGLGPTCYGELTRSKHAAIWQTAAA